MGWIYPYLSSLNIIFYTILSFIYSFTSLVIDVVVCTPKFIINGEHWIWPDYHFTRIISVAPSSKELSSNDPKNMLLSLWIRDDISNYLLLFFSFLLIIILFSIPSHIIRHIKLMYIFIFDEMTKRYRILIQQNEKYK